MHDFGPKTKMAIVTEIVYMDSAHEARIECIRLQSAKYQKGCGGWVGEGHPSVTYTWIPSF